MAITQVLSLIGAPNLAENPLTVVTAGTQHSVAVASRIQSRRPSFAYDTLSTDPLTSWLNFDMSALTDEDIRVGGIAIVNHNLYNFTLNSGTGWIRTPSSQYRFRCHSAPIPHHMLPASLIGQTNLIGNVTYLQESPAFKLTGNWLTIPGGNYSTNSMLQVNFPSSITTALINTQYFDILWRSVGNNAFPPQIRVSLYDNGVLKSVLTTVSVPGAGLAGSQGVLTVPWTNTFSLTGNTVQVRVEGLSNTGASNVEFGAVMWRPDVATFDDTGWVNVPLPALPKSQMTLLNLYISHFFDNPATGLPYVLFEWKDSSPVSSSHFFGTAIIGRKISPDDQIDWGSGQVKAEDGSVAVESASGTETFKAANKKRRRGYRFVINDIQEPTWINNFWGPVLALKGQSGCMFATLDPTQPQYTNEKSIYCRLNTAPEGTPTGVITPPGEQAGALAYQTTLDLREVL